MLTFEKILKVFQAYLDDDPLYETGEIQQRCRELWEKCRET